MEYNALYKSIVKAIKAKEELMGVTCIYANRREISQNPVCGFTLTFEIAESKYTSKTDTSAQKNITKVKLCLLAPSGAGGKRLSETAAQITQAIREQSSFFQYSEIITGKPVYDASSAILSLDISVIYEEEALSDPKNMVIIDGFWVENLIYFKAQRKERTEKGEGELLNGYASSKIFYYEIEFSSSSFVDLPDKGFTVRLRAADRDETYSQCSLEAFIRELKEKDKTIYTYKIMAQMLSKNGGVQ